MLFGLLRLPASSQSFCRPVCPRLGARARRHPAPRTRPSPGSSRWPTPTRHWPPTPTRASIVVAMTIGRKPRREARPLRLTFIRPNKIDLDAGSIRLISDGKTLTTVVRPLKKYTTAPAPATIGIDTFREGPTGPCSSAARPARRPSSCSTCSRAPAPISCSTRWAARSAPRRLAASRRTPIRIDLRDGPDLLLRVDPATRSCSRPSS